MAVASSFVQGRVSPNGLAILTMDRPKALNAMNLEMDITYKNLLDEWEIDPAVKAVLVESSSSRAFSAGMDIKWLAAALKEDISTPLLCKVFAAEYSLLSKIAGYKKPYISLMDGITMGFGLGLSGHGQYRIITERTLIAMPENGIGLFPDVGFAHIAAQTPGQGAIGSYMALTGARIGNAADALYAGFGTHFVQSEKLNVLKEAIICKNLSDNAQEAIEDVLLEFSQDPGAADLEAILPAVVSCFGNYRPMLETIDVLEKMQGSSEAKVSKWANGALVGLRKGAPFSLLLTQRHSDRVASTQQITIDDVLKVEYRMACRMAIRNDFMEGVRAVLVDKDQNPKWEPAHLQEVNLEDVNAIFQPFENQVEELLL